MRKSGSACAKTEIQYLLFNYVRKNPALGRIVSQSSPRPIPFYTGCIIPLSTRIQGVPGECARLRENVP